MGAGAGLAEGLVGAGAGLAEGLAGGGDDFAGGGDAVAAARVDRGTENTPAPIIMAVMARMETFLLRFMGEVSPWVIIITNQEKARNFCPAG
jgi:hypothetical protein